MLTLLKLGLQRKLLWTVRMEHFMGEIPQSNRVKAVPDVYLLSKQLKLTHQSGDIQSCRQAMGENASSPRAHMDLSVGQHPGSNEQHHCRYPHKRWKD